MTNLLDMLRVGTTAIHLVNGAGNSAVLSSASDQSVRTLLQSYCTDLKFGFVMRANNDQSYLPQKYPELFLPWRRIEKQKCHLDRNRPC